MTFAASPIVATGCRLIAVAVVAISLTSAAEASYKITDLGTLGGTYSKANEINNRGEIVGTSRTALDDARAFRYFNGTMQNLGSLSSYNSNAEGLNANDSGQIVGYYNDGIHDRPFLYSGGVMSDIGTLKVGGEGEALSINNVGQVVGYSSWSGGSQHAFLYTVAGGMRDLGTMKTNNAGVSTAKAINNAATATIVGHAAGNTFVQHAFAYTVTGGMVDLGTLGGSASSANAVNDNGQIVGVSQTTNNAASLAFIYNNPVEKMVSLGTLPGLTNSYATSINSIGQVVGYAYTTPGDNTPFLYDGDGMIDLRSLVLDDPATTGDERLIWGLAEASGINDEGWIIGSGWINGEYHGYVLTPVSGPSGTAVPEPGSIVLAAVALVSGGIVVRAARKKQTGP